MRALLVRIGVDQTYGGWNAPVDPGSGEFVYVPIPEGVDQALDRALATPFSLVEPALSGFRRRFPFAEDAALPPGLAGRMMHLDPDFDRLTYGDVGLRRGRALCGFGRGDVVAFFAGLGPVRPCADPLLYALVGLYRVAEVVRAGDVPRSRRAENAHTRRRAAVATDVIVRADPARSGRLRRCIPIGEWRNGAYRIRHELLEAWGGISARDGYIQRSAVPPRLLRPEKFLAWFSRQEPELVAANN